MLCLTFLCYLLAGGSPCERTPSKNSMIRMESIHRNVCRVVGSEAHSCLCFRGWLNLSCFLLVFRSGQDGRNRER